MNKFSLALLSLITSYSPLIAVEPTELREWKSVNGKTVTAKATAFDGETVSMETANGKSYQVPLTKLAKSEHDFLTAHFETKDEEEPSTPDAPKPPSKKGKKGTIQGIEKQTSEDDSFYYHYVPTSALKDRKMPAMFWTSGGKKGDQKSVSTFTKGAELTGMTIITCGNSSNSGPNNSEHIKKNLTHSIEHLNLETDRIFFGGTSGGAARSFGNASKYKYAGGLPVVGYIPSGAKPPKSDYYYIINGAFDYNRYSSAIAADYLGKTATQRLVPGGHAASDYESLNDGIIWLYTMNAYLKKKAKSDELEKFEERFYTYLTKELSGKPWRAYYWTDHLLKTCKLSGDNKSKFEDLHKTLESDDVNVLYLEGREELAKFSKKYFVKVGPGSRHKHTTNDIKNAATKFIAKYGSIPRLKTIGIDLMKKTD